MFVGYPYSWEAIAKYVYFRHSEKYLNEGTSSVRLKRMIYMNVDIEADLMCLLLGGFAFVYEAQDLGSGKDYALKVG